MTSIKKQIKVDISSAKILFSLRLDQNEKNFMFKKQNIYNAKQKTKRQKLKTLISIQTLRKNLNRDD